MQRTTHFLRLPLVFDVVGLNRDLAHVVSSRWIEHFNSNAYDGHWSCLPLRSVDGRVDHIMPIESGRFQDTPLLSDCPYFREVLDTFQCEKTSVRLMSLAPGGQIKPHHDEATSLEDGITRIHIPIQTSPDVLFQIEGEEIHFDAGYAWYLNASCTHAVRNGSPIDRVHLMLDCVTNPWLEQIFRDAGGILRPPHKYPDASITDQNALEVILNLRASGSEAAQLLADEIYRIYCDTRFSLARVDPHVP